MSQYGRTGNPEKDLIEMLRTPKWPDNPEGNAWAAEYARAAAILEAVGGATAEQVADWKRTACEVGKDRHIKETHNDPPTLEIDGVEFETVGRWPDSSPKWSPEAIAAWEATQ